MQMDKRTVEARKALARVGDAIPASRQSYHFKDIVAVDDALLRAGEAMVLLAVIRAAVVAAQQEGMDEGKGMVAWIDQLLPRK